MDIIMKYGEPFLVQDSISTNIVTEGSDSACMFSITGIQKGEFMGVPPSAKEVKIECMGFFRFKGSKIAERWELIDLLSAAKQLGVRQQISDKNAVLVYGEVQANAQLKDKINGLFKKHLTWMTFLRWRNEDN